MIRLVRGAKPAPGDEVGAWRDRRGRIDLQQGKALGDREQVARSRSVEQLRANRDAPSLLLGQPVHEAGGYVKRSVARHSRISRCQPPRNASCPASKARTNSTPSGPREVTSYRTV